MKRKHTEQEKELYQKKGVKPDGMYNDISWKEGIL